MCSCSCSNVAQSTLVLWGCLASASAYTLVGALQQQAKEVSIYCGMPACVSLSHGSHLINITWSSWLGHSLVVSSQRNSLRTFQLWLLAGAGGGVGSPTGPTRRSWDQKKATAHHQMVLVCFANAQKHEINKILLLTEMMMTMVGFTGIFPCCSDWLTGAGL